MNPLYDPVQAAKWLRDRVTGNLSSDSRKVGRGDGFIAWPGAATDARRYVGDLLKAGAGACLVEAQGVRDALGDASSDPRVAAYVGLKVAAAPIAAAYFNDPSKELQVIAVTGTNGKTSTAWWLAQAWCKLGQKCGVIGTLGIGAPDAVVFNGLTTPDPVLLQQQLRRFVDEGFKACVIEASSIGLAEHRLDATHIQIAIFTNFTQDHLDYHGSMDAYWGAKQALFGWPGLCAAVVNIDDAKGSVLKAMFADSSVDVWTVSATGTARLQAQHIEQRGQALVFDVVEGSDRQQIQATSAGVYNVSNLLGVVAAMRASGITLGDAVRACSGLPSVPGRLDTFTAPGQPLVVVDYAHTPDALEKVLLALGSVAKGRAGNLWCVFGCGGERDALKRPLMAAVAQKYADQVVVTSDNPRGESAANIISQILSGLSPTDSVHVQADRALAISHAIAKAEPGDVVLLAGKGHENYQEICGVKSVFSGKHRA